MLKIKLARFGKKNQPHYRIVVNEARSKRDGKYIALLGHYAPVQEPKILEIDLKAYQEWIAKGAQPTETVAALAKRLESGNPFPAKKARPSKKAKAKAAAPAETAVKEEPATEEVAEQTDAEATETATAAETAEAAAETEAKSE
jgi:small subunit ribosomal protein S16